MTFVVGSCISTHCRYDDSSANLEIVERLDKWIGAIQQLPLRRVGS